jgi:hypothetical protein
MKKFRSLLTLLVVTLLFSGCTYNFIIPEELPPDPTDPNAPEISFSAEILPIFNNGNNCTSCHGTGGTSPDLTTEKAYNSINNSKYISLGTPEESKIYHYPSPDTDTHKQQEYTANEAALVLGWIIQGAQNN